MLSPCSASSPSLSPHGQITKWVEGGWGSSGNGAHIPPPPSPTASPAAARERRKGSSGPAHPYPTPPPLTSLVKNSWSCLASLRSFWATLPLILEEVQMIWTRIRGRTYSIRTRRCTSFTSIWVADAEPGKRGRGPSGLEPARGSGAWGCTGSEVPEGREGLSPPPNRCCSRTLRAVWYRWVRLLPTGEDGSSAGFLHGGSLPPSSWPRQGVEKEHLAGPPWRTWPSVGPAHPHGLLRQPPRGTSASLQQKRPEAERLSPRQGTLWHCGGYVCPLPLSLPPAKRVPAWRLPPRPVLTW